jgi:hypothetical protein
MSRHLKIWVALLIFLLAPVLAWSQGAAPNAGGGNAPPPPSANQPPQPQTDQTTNIAYFTLRDGMNSTLTLNNLAPTQTNVTVTLFNAEGRSQVLDPIVLDPHSFKQIELQEVVKGELFDSGNIQVAFHGIPMAVTCQVSVYSLEKRVSFESREQDMMDFESSSLNGILSLPPKDARGFLAVTNVSKNKVTAKLTVAPKMKEIELYPRETHLVRLDEEFGLHAPATALVKLSQNGLPGDVITTAFVVDLKDGYSSAFAMSDPKVMRSSHLAGAHLRFGQPDPSEGFPAGTTFRSPLLLANVTDKPVTAHVSVDYTVAEKLAMTPLDPKQDDTQDKFSNVALKDVTIAPGDVQRIELADELAKLGVPTPVKEAGVEITHEAPPGSLIGHLVSADQTGDYSFEVPIKDPAAMNEMMEGAYPWTLENGTNTVLHLKNTTDKSVVGLVVFTFPGGTYNPDRIKLEPYQTVAIDIQKLKDSKKLDVRQKLFPVDAMHGQVVWRQETPYSLIGRAEEVDSKAGIARSFSCEVDCCSWYYQDFSLDPGGFVTGYNEGTDCSGYSFGPYASQANYWYSDNTSIATIDSWGTVSLVQGNGGDTYVHGVFSQRNYTYSGGYCQPYYTNYDASLGISIRLSAYIFNGLSNGLCTWVQTCAGACGSPHTTNSDPSTGLCFTTGPYKQCYDVLVNRMCTIYRAACYGKSAPGICTN